MGRVILHNVTFISIQSSHKRRYLVHTATSLPPRNPRNKRETDAAHDYTPATYQFNDFSGSGILERGPPPSARQRAIDQEYDEREQSIEKFRERNALDKISGM